AVPVDTAEYLWKPENIEQLVGRELIRYNDGSYAIGHKERAKLVLHHALGRWNARELWGEPADLVWKYLSLVGEPLIRATLARLDLVGVRGDQSDRFQEATRYIASAYDMVLQLERQMDRVCAADRTWGDNVGAAVFAAKAMALLNRREQWEQMAEFI